MEREIKYLLQGHVEILIIFEKRGEKLVKNFTKSISSYSFPSVFRVMRFIGKVV